MNRYSEHKKSGLQYFEEIPTNWVLKRLCDVIKKGQYSFTGGPFGSDLKSNDYTDEGVRIIQLQNIGVGNFLNDYKIYTSIEKANELYGCNIFPNDIIIAKMADPVARACIIPNIESRFLMASDGVRLVPNKNNFNKYLVYSINSIHFNFQAIVNSFGSTRLRIGLNTLKKLNIILPPVEEQTAIAQYLEIKTQAIDKKINLLTQKSNFYKELRKRTIDDAVGRGLNKNAKFVSNEFGSTPSHWRIGRLKDISKSMSSGATPLTNISAYYENGILNWVNTGDLNDGIINECQYKISEVAIKDYPNLKINKIGTLLIAMYGATICKIGLLNIEATTNQACCCINFKKDSYSKFVFYWFLANKNKIISLSVGGTQPNISQGIISKLFIATPPLEEQISIAEYLDKKIQKIDAIVTNIGKQIETLKELRKTLINDVVTGKIKVTK